MFRKLLRALLPSFVPAEVDANYAFFDKTPENEPLPFADKAPVNDQAIPYENDLEGAYLDYLFGCDARPMQQNDSLSHFIYHQLSLLMHELAVAITPTRYAGLHQSYLKSWITQISTCSDYSLQSGACVGRILLPANSLAAAANRNHRAFSRFYEYGGQRPA